VLMARREAGTGGRGAMVTGKGGVRRGGGHRGLAAAVRLGSILTKIASSSTAH
jgi:hypothetical protein